jgi:peptidoglycan/xylan/chitin deacetylase (PgdA/CDA1 family)
MAKGIDAGGNIVGTAYTFDGHRRAVMWVPLPNVVPPVVSTSPATDLTKQSATLNGILTDDGGEACQYRFRYKEEKGDYIYTSWTGSVTSGQSFSETISDLAHSKTYYFNAQARNSAGESEWGNQQIFGKPKEFMITFDDGPLPDATESIVAQLNGIILDDGKPVKAGFFMVGCNGCQDSGAPMPRYGWLMPGDPWKTKGSVRDYGSMVRHVALVPAEHVIGNHTQHHMMFWPWIAKQDVEAEITACEKELKLALDPISRPLDMVFRPPYFAYNPAVERATRSLGFKIIMGAGGGRRSAVDASWWISSVEDIEQNATDLILNWKGNEPCVLVFHDASPITPYNIAEIIRYLREEQGFTLVHFDPTRISDPSSEDLVIQELRGEASGPIDLVVIGPDGLVLSKEENLFPNAFYEELNIDIGSIDIDDLFVIEYPEPGFYEIYVIPESSALPGDKYSLDVYYDEELVFSEDRAQVSDIPSAPYRFPLR